MSIFSREIVMSSFSSFSSFVKMVAVEKAKLKCAIELYYHNNQSKDKKNQTYHHFKTINTMAAPIITNHCIKEMDMDIVIKMFDKLEGKIQQAHKNG